MKNCFLLWTPVPTTSRLNLMTLLPKQPYLDLTTAYLDLQECRSAWKMPLNFPKSSEHRSNHCKLAVRSNYLWRYVELFKISRGVQRRSTTFIAPGVLRLLSSLVATTFSPRILNMSFAVLVLAFWARKAYERQISLAETKYYTDRTPALRRPKYIPLLHVNCTKSFSPFCFVLIQI